MLRVSKALQVSRFIRQQAFAKLSRPRKRWSSAVGQGPGHYAA